MGSCLSSAISQPRGSWLPVAVPGQLELSGFGFRDTFYLWCQPDPATVIWGKGQLVASVE